MTIKGSTRLQLEALFSDLDIDEQEKPDSRTEQVITLDDNGSTERVAETQSDLPRTEFALWEVPLTASLKVLIVQPDPGSTRVLENIFAECGGQTWCASNLPEAHAYLEHVEPELVVVDLHLPNDDWLQVLRYVTQNSPTSRILSTSAYPDPQRELEAREQGVQVLVRKPFTRARLDQAMSELFDLSAAVEPASEDATSQATLPKVRVPVRVKITAPYAILALLLAMAASYLVSRIVFESLDTRFTNQLIEMGKLVADRMVQEENQLLDGLRLVANMQQVPEVVSAGDAEGLRELILPIAVNYGQEAIEVLDVQGTSVLSLRHRVGGNPEDYVADRGTDVFAQWGFVQKVLLRQIDQHGDKYAGVARPPWGDYLYVAGPIFDQGDQLVGVVLVGESLPTLVRRIRQDTLAHTTLYAFDGRPIASTLLSEGGVVLSSDYVLDVLNDQDNDSLVRDRTVASIDYSEILGPWEVRRGDDLGVVGVSLPKTVFVQPSQVTRWQVFGIVTLAFFAVIALGVYLAGRITRPLLRVVQASGQVAQGNLDIRVESKGNDEVAVLAHSFNYMVSGLREGSVYRDLLGRTVSPVVREQLRQTFASGDLRLEGQSAVTTVLMSDIRGFTMLSERTDPTVLLAWLNEYFAELVPIINAHGGVVNAFEGDAILAFFGILPRLLKPQESAYRACLAAREMLQAIERINAHRIWRGEPPFVTGIGVNTGPVTAGGLGSADRVHYTIIGDTVNTASRLQEITRRIGQTSAVLSEDTWSALNGRCDEFYVESLGAHILRGKREPLQVYRLWSVVEAGEE